MIGGTHPVWNGVLRPLTPCERLTFLYLTARRNEDGHAWPLAPTIATATGYSLPHTKAALAGLRRRGLIVHAGLADPRHPQHSAVRWFLPPVVSPAIPLDEPVVLSTTPPEVSSTTPPVVLPTTPIRNKRRNISKKHTPLPPNGEEGADVEVIIRDGFQLDRRGRTVGVATSDMVVSTSSSQVNGVEVQQVFDVWIESTGRTGRTRLDAKRRKAIQRALSDYPLPDVLDAVRGWQRDPWPERVDHNDVTVLLRDAAHIEKFRRLQQEGPPRRRVEPRSYRTIRETSDDPDAFDADMAMLFGRNGREGAKRHAIEASSEEVEP